MILTSKTISKTLGISIFGVFLLLPTWALAQQSVVLSVSPTKFDISANPSQTWTSSVRVINANPFPLTVYAEPVNFTSAGDSGVGSLMPILEPISDGSTLAEWIDVNKQSITIPAEQTVSIPFTVTVPESAAPGGHYAAILIGTQPVNGTADQPQVQTAQVVTSLLFLRVAGEIDERAAIRSFTTERQIYEQADITLQLRLENKGNVHLQPQGDIEIYNMWGQPRGVIPVNRNSQFGDVLPSNGGGDNTRTYRFQWTADWSLADMGRHRASVTLAYGEQVRQFVDATTYFWIIPWRVLLLVFLTIGLFLVLTVWAIKLYIRRMLQLAGITPEIQQVAPRQARRHVSVMAPIETGILDLRTGLQNGHGSPLQNIYHWLLKYKLFFIITLALLALSCLFFWYLFLIIQNEHDYTVQYEHTDGSKSTIQTDLATTTSTELNSHTISVIDNSGISGALDEVRARLADTAYQVEVQSNTVSETKSRSILVYDPSLLEQVKELQTLFPNMLVSAYTAQNDTDAPLLVLYVGSDIAEP